ncbi:hypothetical protein [Brevibacillus laterosporus]|uniref:hypothetical protein n=1 Tax=Brevibacillus laterosporus TaxID=1465 RepID=UPI001EF39C63|nr:hypothetical protein [Brevibacillus laterosporus]MCG7317877.1 hypothetical protein [Brevibacillus laterosporus]
MKKKKLVSTLLIASILTTSACYLPTQIFAKENIPSQDELNNVKLNILKDEENVVTLEVTSALGKELVEVNKQTKKFTITDKNGEVKKYDANDFVVDHNATLDTTDNNIPEEFTALHDGQAIEQNNPVIPKSVQSSDYIPGPTGKGWDLRSFEQYDPPVHMYYKGYNEEVKAPKKFSFDRDTTISVIVGALAAFIPGGIEASVIIGVIRGVGVAVVSGAIQRAMDPTVWVQKYSYERYFYVDKGFVIRTKSWTSYLLMKEFGLQSKEPYATGGYNQKFNNWTDSDAAEYAYKLWKKM